MAEKIMEMRHITKTFPGVKALDDVSIEAYAGEMLALCGENGAGKSTLMKILSGSYPFHSYQGEIFVNGQACSFQNTAQSEKAGIAMIYQEISMHLDETVAENVFLGRWPRKKGIVDWEAMRRQTREYLEMLHIQIDPMEILRNLNASQQQLVSIARALSKRPKILVLDEPTSSLTTTESERLFKILHHLKAQGIASILISHKLDEVFAHADRITVLRDGKSISTCRKSEADEKTVVADMVGRTITSYYPKEKVPIGRVVLEIKNISVPHPYTKGKNIVEDVSFAVRSGEVLGIAGLVGAGRSELVSAIFGKIPKTSGQVFLEGREIKVKNPKDAIGHGIALLTEERKTDGLVGVLSIKQNITLASLARFSKRGWMNLKQEERDAQEYMEKISIKAPGLSTLAQQLSGGNQQKVVLSKWLMRNPRVLIMDEPTRGIDVGAKYEIYKIMMQLAKQGIAIIMISSELPELISMSDRLIVLARGKIQGDLSARECSQESVMMLATRTKNKGEEEKIWHM